MKKRAVASVEKNLGRQVRNVRLEWLETDGVGGFACGTVAGIRTRRYHGLLVSATTPPTGRMVLVNGLEVWLETGSGRYALSAQRYAPDVIFPNGHERIMQFRLEPWPTWEYQLENGMVLRQEILVVQSSGETLVRWESVRGIESIGRLLVRPLLSGRNYHALHRENSAFDFAPLSIGQCIRWRPYTGVPAIDIVSNGTYTHDPLWYRNFRYEEESRRGLDDIEDLAAPGTFTLDLKPGPAILLLRSLPAAAALDVPVVERADAGIAAETLRRARYGTPIERAAEQYIVRRGTGDTIIAGYPWFTDWGRDTFIAMRGLCIASGRLDVALTILLAWADTLSDGMLPNKFPDAGVEPEYNSVDASLWFVVAVHDLLKESGRSVSHPISQNVKDKLQSSVIAILDAYAAGTRFNIHMDPDGLLASGQPGVQLTWMDAKIGDCVVTPRIGKPVEVQALWLNSLQIGSQISSVWADPFERGLRSFGERFWHEDGGYLFDNVDVDHRRGTTDASFRPNQIFAIGGLPMAVLSGERARRVVSAVEERLLTPMGLRSLAAGERNYVGHYTGNARARDAAYHQGTVWPWLMGPFVEAWLRVHGTSPENRRQAQQRFLSPLHRHLSSVGLGHISELADADPPHAPRGCPFQAWSLGEFCRVQRLLEDDGPQSIFDDMSLFGEPALIAEARA
jgi:predicted glycogen debranching enzyme